MRVTHQEIADHLGIARSTVTQALHRTRRSTVGADLRQSILAAAHELGYQPPNRTTHTIGLLVGGASLGDAATGALLRDIQRELSEQGYQLLVLSVWGEQLEAVCQSLTPKSVDGVLLSHTFGGRAPELMSPDVPFVVLSNEEYNDPKYDIVSADTIGTLEQITRTLLDMGHRNLCLASAVSSSAVYKHTEQGIRRELARAGLTGPDHLRVLHFDTGPGGAAPHGRLAKEFLEGFLRPPVPTVVIASDEWRATPIAYALRDADIRIPSDVSFISLPDNYDLWELVPPCTTTTFYNGSIAKLAVSRLLEKIEQPDSPPRHQLVVGEIIHRGSLAPPRTV